MPYRVFSQSPERRIDETAFEKAARHSDVAFTVLRSAEAGSIRIRATAQVPPRTQDFTVSSRPRREPDLDEARAAETRGRASGMAALAGRCPTVWEVTADNADAQDDYLTLELCGVLAFVALGPVLPPDGSTLFGVRGARERASRLLRR